MDELVLILREGKAPFIGVLINGHYNPKWAIVDWIDKGTGSLKILLDPSHELVLYLATEKSQIRHAMKYDPVKLLKFYALTLKSPYINFGYLNGTHENYRVLKTEKGNNMVLKVQGIEVIDQLLSLIPDKKGKL